MGVNSGDMSMRAVLTSEDETNSAKELYFTSPADNSKAFIFTMSPSAANPIGLNYIEEEE